MNDLQQFLKQINAAKNLLADTLRQDKKWIAELQETERKLNEISASLDKYITALEAAMKLNG